MEKATEEKKLSDIDLKAKSMGAIHAIKVGDDTKEYSLYLKKPHRDIVGLYYGRVKENPIKAAEILLKASHLIDISDKEIFEDDELFYSAYMQIDEYLDVIKIKKNRSVTL